VQLGARVGDPASDDLVSTALFGYEMAPRGLPDPPPTEGEVIADDSLRADGVEEGDELLLGPSRSPVTVVGFVDDTRYANQGTLWGSIETWEGVTAANRPDQVVAEGDVQALVVRTDGSRSPADVAQAIDAAVDGETETLTLAAAIDALPGVSQQRSTFNQIIGVTLVVALVVVALFFALITVERLALYGILAAIGASGPTLFAGVVVQAVVVTLVAAATGAAAAVTLDLVLPPGALPFAVTSGRLLASGCLLLLAAILGSAFSLRRVLRIDPASAIGTAS
jgi:putative ABC transport system permease protein